MKFKSNIEIQAGVAADGSTGSNGQVLSSTGTGVAWIDQIDVVSSADSAESVHISVKNTSGAQILKGTPVYVTGETGNSGKIEVAPADASDSAKMPALGLLESTLNNNGEGFCVQGGLLEGLATATIDGTATTANDTVYVKSGGGLTMTKPTGTGLIQNIAKVARVHASNGSLVVSSILRTNDVPNLTTGKIWVGDGNTVESTVVHLDEVYGRMGIGTASPDSLLEISQQLSAAYTIDYPYIISSRDDGNSINQQGGEGVGIKFRIAGNDDATPGNSLVGASIAAIRERQEDADSSTGLGFFITQNDETLDEAVRIDHDGNVGIGTTSPTHKLQVVGDGAFNSTLGVQDPDISSNGLLRLSHDSTGSSIYSNPGSSNGSTVVLSLGINYSEKMRIANNGNVGIGTSSPNQKLHVNGGTQLGDINATVNFGTVALKVVEGTVSEGPTLGSGAKGAQAVLYSNGAFGMYTGVSGSGDTWMQSQRNDTLTYTYNILLNPAGGNVGIGTASPNGIGGGIGTLDIRGTSGGGVRFGISEGLESTFFTIAAGGYLGTISNIPLYFQTNNSVKATILANGDVGIGTTSPTTGYSKVLQINASGNGSTLRLTDAGSGSEVGSGLELLQYGVDSYIINRESGPINFWASGSQKMRINSSGNVSIGNSNNTYKLDVSGTGRFTSTVTATNFILSSDKTLKDSISDINTDHVDVKWKNFELKSEPGVKRAGVVAQELEEKHPEFVRTDKDGMKSVAYIDLLIAKIAELEARLGKLEK